MRTVYVALCLVSVASYAFAPTPSSGTLTAPPQSEAAILAPPAPRSRALIAASSLPLSQALLPQVEPVTAASLFLENRKRRLTLCSQRNVFSNLRLLSSRAIVAACRTQGRD